MVLTNQNVSPSISVGADPIAPFVNTSMSSLVVPTQYRHFVSCMPTHNVASLRASSITGGSGYHASCSTNYLVGGTPVTRFLDVLFSDVSTSPQSPQVPPGQVKHFSLR